MKKTLIIIILGLAAASCVKEEVNPRHMETEPAGTIYCVRPNNKAT